MARQIRGAYAGGEALLMRMRKAVWSGILS